MALGDEPSTKVASDEFCLRYGDPENIVTFVHSSLTVI